jgi:adenylate kinase
MNIVLLGPPGAGKGTQAKILANRLGLPHISTGEILRQNVSGNTVLGLEAKSYMNKGLLVADDLVTQMLTQRLNEPDVSNGFILDGYPRNLAQAKTLGGILEKRNAGIDYVIYLETSQATIIQRLSGRLVCKSCGANFHITNMAPKKAMTCDNCSGSLYQRDDDKEETIKKRLAVYEQEVLSLVDFYEKSSKFYRLSSDVSPEVVLGNIVKLIRQSHGSIKV